MVVKDHDVGDDTLAEASQHYSLELDTQIAPEVPVKSQAVVVADTEQDADDLEKGLEAVPARDIQEAADSAL